MPNFNDNNKNSPHTKAKADLRSNGKNPTTNKRVTLSEQVDIPGLKRPMRISLPDGGPSDRTEYVEYALDMLVHNLIGSGQLDSSKAHLVRTPEMRTHINLLADRVEAAQKAGFSTQISSKHTHNPPKGTKWALQPNALPISIITNSDPTPAHPHANVMRPRTGERKRTNVLRVPVTPNPRPIQDKKTPIKTGTGTVSHRPTSALKMAPSFNDKQLASTSLQKPQIHHRVFGRAGGAASTIEMRPKPTVQTQEFGSFQLKPAISMGHEGFRAKLDMRGFTNEEIALDLKGRVLLVTASRPKRDGLNPRKTIETVDIPFGVNLDHLKVARRVDGILVIQESPIDRSPYMN